MHKGILILIMLWCHAIGIKAMQDSPPPPMSQSFPNSFLNNDAQIQSKLREEIKKLRTTNTQLEHKIKILSCKTGCQQTKITNLTEQNSQQCKKIEYFELHSSNIEAEYTLLQKNLENTKLLLEEENKKRLSLEKELEEKEHTIRELRAEIHSNIFVPITTEANNDNSCECSCIVM